MNGNLKQAVIFSFLFCVSVTRCQRRIVHGENVIVPKRYVVYFVEASISPMGYDEWLCGGALVTPEFIITSAACVEDVRHLYAIAGYDKYVPKEEIYSNPCTNKFKKKIIFTCMPKLYELDYEKLEKWAYIDIALAKVESPYNLVDKEYETLCSYIPQPIDINFETKYQEEGVDAIAMGWGHTKKWRADSDIQYYNSLNLQYTPILIASKERCKKEYENYKGLSKVIDTYMICSMEAGNIDAKGSLKIKSKPTANGCPVFDGPKQLQLFDAKNCDPIIEEDTSWLDNSRRQNSNETSRKDFDMNTTETFVPNVQSNNSDTIKTGFTRRNGICQNDHGGPIVTWIGSTEYLIAVASVFKVSKDLDCMGPYLYTSTECNGAFIACVLDLGVDDQTRRAMCDRPAAEKGYETIETHISWLKHPDGPDVKVTNPFIKVANKNSTRSENVTSTSPNINYISSDSQQVTASNKKTTKLEISTRKSTQQIVKRATRDQQITASTLNMTAILSGKI